MFDRPRVNVDNLLMDILRPALPLLSRPGVPVEHVQQRLPADLTNLYPFVRAHRFGGSASDGVDRATCSLDVFVSGDRAVAFDLAFIALQALQDAAGGPVFPSGSVADYDEVSGPAEVPDALRPDGSTHVQATFELYVC